MSDNSPKTIGASEVAPKDGDQLVYDAASNKYVTRSRWEKYNFQSIDFTEGNEAESNIDLLVRALAAGEFLEEVVVYVESEWNDPGDSVSLQLKIAGQDLFDGSQTIEGASDFYLPLPRARIDLRQPIAEVSRNIQININVAEFGAHTLAELTTGSVIVFLKVLSLPA